MRHHPATARVKPIIHVGFLPMLWKIVTRECGERWSCHIVKQYLRQRLGWTVDITDDLKNLTARLPKPSTR